MSKKDYYELLGIGKSASPAEIKVAYRKLAVKYHPDKNQGNKEAEHKFKEISEAYEILKDDQKRAAYDRFGHNAFSQGGHSGSRGAHPGGFEGFGNFSDVFNDFFGDFANTHGRQTQIKGADLRYNMNISLEEAFNGKNVDINFSAASKCDSCKGSGSKDSHTTNCITCNGSGRIRAQQGFFAIERTCQACHGEGKIIKNPCGSCKGSGVLKKERHLSVNIPAGIDNGTKIRLAGEGEPGMRGNQSGDLYIFINITNHQIFTRQDNDLSCNVPIKFTTAILGGSVEVPSIEGKKVELTIPAGTQSGDKFRLKDRGMHRLRSTARGDLFVTVQVETPVKLNKKQIELLHEFEKEETDKSNPKFSSFLDKIKDLFE